ncbi:MAG: GldG family protein [Hyphomonadaceae bacterium]
MSGRRRYALLAGLAAILAFAGGNLALGKWFAGARIDFTQARLYTLSTSAKQVLRRLVEPVELELVYSREAGAAAPGARAHAERVRELLHEIALQSGGKVRVRELDPEPFSEEEDRVSDAGLSPVPVEGGDPIYLGVIGRNTTADTIVIPFLSPDRDALLEYELVRLIAQLDDPSPPVVAVLSSSLSYLGDGGDAADAFILREMSRSFRIRTVSPDFVTLPADADILLAFHPPQLSDWQAYQVEQFILAKGRAILAFDPAARVEAAMERRSASAMPRSLSDLLGAEISADVLADPELAMRVTVDAGGGRTAMRSQPLFIAATPDHMSRRDPVTADLTRDINLGLTGWLIPGTDASTSFEPLLTSSAEAVAVPAAEALATDDTRALIENGVRLGEPKPLAARISGNLLSHFASAPRPAMTGDPLRDAEIREEVSSAPAPLIRSARPAQVVLIADTDVFEDAFYINQKTGAPAADNAAFLLNALDNLAGDDALAELRSRTPAARPLERIEAMYTRARSRMEAEQAQLEARLSEIEPRLAALQRRRNAEISQAPSRVVEDSPDLRAARDEARSIRRQLRDIERDYRRDVDGLEAWLKFLNIWLPPLLAALCGVGVFIWRSRARGAAR